jgi:thiol:disulfide interchange protein DsbD
MHARSLARLALAAWLALAPAGAAAGLPEPPAGSAGAGAYQSGVPRLRARLLVDAPDAGAGWRAGVLFEPAPGWYLYWRHPGESGLPTRVDFELDGSAGELEWPAPQAFVEDDMVSYGYAQPVLLAAALEPARAGAPLRAKAEVLVCKDQCLPASFALERPLRAEADPRARDAVRELFRTTAAALPLPAAARGIEVEARWARIPRAEGEPLAARLRVRGCGAARGGCAALAPAAGATPLFAFEPAPWLVRAHVAEASRDELVLELSGSALPGAADPRWLRGLLALRGEDGAASPVEIALPVPAPGAEAAAAIAAHAPGAGVSAAALARALLFGLLGGLVLNLMPCVLPVLALKLTALAELSQRSRREVALHAAAYAAGIQLTLLALALTVVLLRAGGTAVGWGFQLQEPAFVALIAVLLVVFATNLFGAFELEFAPDRLARVGADASGAARSFFDGLLAVVLATPCSAPFLGTAVGFAFASGAAVCVAIFAAIGLGLAAPFAAVSLWPGLARRLPRGGTWMLELRRALGFALLLSVVWLLWVMGRQSGSDAALGLLALLLCVAIAGWLFGIAQRARGRLGVGVLLASVAAIALVGHGRIEWTPQASAEPAAAEGAQPYERAALEAALASGRPAFVYFTADWCITCKLNERRVLETLEARQELARLGFAVFRADWTRRDAHIAGELARLGRAGVPVYALYAPGRADSPRLLPDLLSLEGFQGALREVAGAEPPLRTARNAAAGALP